MDQIKSIGIRVTPTSVYFSIISAKGKEIEIIALDIVKCPKSMEIPEQLKFVRNTLGDIINEFKVKNACIRVTESNARKISIHRIYIEGVIQELFASSTIEKYFIGQISNISTKLGIKRNEFKPYADGEIEFPGLENWGNLKIEQRESIMAAISAINI
ncbi:hypothetical protein [Sphingobacterium humi]|uniref:DUF3010 family protein n=1 Tax=Sphingobacterium humi TaxID=1796905 RepID=A0A6N8L2Y3_9SPHI|nr:hypothetical protein [Sphingobacterium humi]MVZ62142.1 hypothetical protein [Sphingobacterium humi]